MKRQALWGVPLFGLLIHPIVFGAETEKTGIVKGAVSIGGRPTPDAVVSVEGLPDKYLKSHISNLKSKKAVVDQRDMKFTPRVLPVLVGATVEFPNSDKTFHNVFSTSEAKRFDLGLYAPGKSRSVTFDKPGVIKILCNVHPSMEAYVVARGHPYYAAVDARGNYRVDGIPLGRYRLEVWHPDLGTSTTPFEMVRVGEVLTLDVEMKGRR